ncbi:MAG: hypothetical protein JW808_06645 [Victivallales bacterium]|nr:hypothetical protein [Victivallales bacterium]
MSRQIGLDTVFLRPTPRVAHTEYSMNYHVELVKKISGLDPGVAENACAAIRALYDEWDIDMVWRTNDGPVNWAEAGRCTDMGHAVYASDGSDRRESSACPFESPEEVWDFDPAQEYGLPDFSELVAYYRDSYEKASAEYPGQLVTGGYYRTLVSGASQSFGWDMFLMAASDKEKFAKVLERFGDYTMHYVKAQAQTPIEVFIQHDDMVWTEGPFMDPGFYREAIFPVYKRLWSVLKEAGKKVLFCSDGTFDMFMEDIAECGADGFIFEPSNNFDFVVEKFGRTHCIVGSKVDCRTMTFGKWEEVKKEIDDTLALAKGCPGLMFAVGNHIPANISDEMCEQYVDYLKSVWGR